MCQLGEILPVQAYVALQTSQVYANHAIQECQCYSIAALFVQDCMSQRQATA